MVSAGSDSQQLSRTPEKAKCPPGVFAVLGTMTKSASAPSQTRFAARASGAARPPWRPRAAAKRAEDCPGQEVVFRLNYLAILQVVVGSVESVIASRK